MVRAGPGGAGNRVFWSDLVDWLSQAYDIMIGWTTLLFKFFMTEIGDLIDDYLPGAVGDLLEGAIDLIDSIVGIDLLQLTFIEFTLGSLIPFIMVFTIYRYLKQ